MNIRKFRVRFYDMAIQQYPRQATVEATSSWEAEEYVRKHYLICGGEIVSVKEVVKKIEK